MATGTSLLTGQGAGERVVFGGGLVTFKVTSAQSNGSLLVVEQIAAQGKATPLHVHPDLEETGYLLDGEVLVHFDGVEYVAVPGDTAHFPRGVAHSFLVTTEVARMLWIVTPGESMEAFFRQAGDPLLDGALPSPELDIPRLISVGESTGAMKVIGPPPFHRQ